MYYHKLDRSEEKHRGFAIVRTGSKFIQDCFQIEVGRRSYILRVMTVIPVIEKFVPELLTKALQLQLDTCSQKNSLSFFHSHDREQFGLQTGKVSEVLVVEYRFNEARKLVSQYVYIGQVELVQQFTFNEYEMSSGTTLHMELLHEVLNTKNHLQKMSRSAYVAGIRSEHGFGAEFVCLALECFNEYCRTFSRTKLVPYVSPPDKTHKHGFQISRGYARFNHGSSNPCSFINTANLVRYLDGKEPLITQEELKAYLPSK